MRYRCVNRVLRRFVPIIHCERHPLLVRAWQSIVVHPIELDMWCVDGGSHPRHTVHTGVAVLFDPGGQNGWRRRGVGQAPGSRSRLQVRTRRDTGILCFFSTNLKLSSCDGEALINAINVRGPGQGP